MSFAPRFSITNAATGQTIYTPPPALEVATLMRDLIAWMNDPRHIHPVIVSAIAQFQLVHIHPFLDGNGRASRLLSMLCLYRAGYDFKRLFSISEYYDRDRASFYRALQGVRRDLLIGQHGLTARQALVLGHVLDRGRITIGELEGLCSGTPRRTLQRDLKALVDKGLLLRSGSTNRHEYRPRDVGA